MLPLENALRKLGRDRKGVPVYKRVVVPALVANSAYLAAYLYGATFGLWRKHMIDMLIRREGPSSLWLPPTLPTSWLLLLAIFFAVRMCVASGGSRREALLVALSPALVMGVIHAVVGVEAAGSAWPSLALGSMRPALEGTTTVGTAMVVHDYVGNWLSALATSLAVYWLYLFVARHPVGLPATAAAATSPDATASAQTPA